MTTRHALAIDQRRFLATAPSRPKTASGGLQPETRHRVSRWRLQGADASGKMRPSYDPARRGAHLPQSGKEESAPCRILRQSAEAGQGALPGRVGMNGGFNDAANLTFYRLTYEQNLRDAGYAEYALYGTALLSGVGGYFGVIGAGTSLAAGTGAGTSGLLADALGDNYRQYIQAIRDIEKYNNSGC